MTNLEPGCHGPDPNHPVVFPLRREGEAEPMIHWGPTLFGARNDGEPTAFDIKGGSKAMPGTGDIALRITRGPVVGKRFDWAASVEAGGAAGLIPCDAGFMVTAPADG